MNLSDRLRAMPVYERCSEVRKMPGRSGGIWPAGSAGGKECTMWLFTLIGFFSIVQKKHDQPDQVTIRSRVRKDLEDLVSYLPTASAIRETAQADYRFRITASKDDLARATATLVRDIDYDNFKDEVARQQGYERAGSYGAVWSTLYALQEQQVA